ncbi:MAG TPA: alpha-galactosidase, partial [Ardenticatenaceae bacterium]|nr:alpha-galactosidase [Ardenticatenaceae bacterium]
HHIVTYPRSRLIEQWQTIHNSGSQSMRVERIDSISLDIPAGDYELMYFTSSWGAEFEELRRPLDGPTLLETRAGRSSNDRHPWFALFRSDGEILSGAVVWSGNWLFSFEPNEAGGYRLRGGLHDWEFFKELRPGEVVEGAHVVLVLGADGDLDTVTTEYARVGRAFWYPHNQLSQALPVEWNHWWSYSDRFINEAAFRANVDVAARLGVEVCTLDAGWFGPTDPESDWYDYRGDWDLVNTRRFPSGLRALSDYARGKGMKFGLWCEIEGLGQHATLARSYPEFVALRDGRCLGYVCFGNPAVQVWAEQTLDRLITDYGCDWLKLDFNLDPGAGCNRTDHGHGAGDGLYEHYQGYYRLLDRLRARYPEVLLESCSSGGLRIDLGLMRRTHTTYLSDPDWPEHGLQIFWGATTMLAPTVCLHWSWSEWDGGDHPRQTFNPRDPALTAHQLDYYTRISMLGGFGLSQKLPELPDWVAERLTHHTRVYREQVRRFVRSGDLYRLTAQPKRGGRGDRWAGFQYSLADGSEHLLFVFRLDAGEPERALRLKALEPQRRYTLTWLSSERVEQQTGAELLHGGLRFTDLREEDSALILLA